MLNVVNHAGIMLEFLLALGQVRNLTCPRASKKFIGYLRETLRRFWMMIPRNDGKHHLDWGQY